LLAEYGVNVVSRPRSRESSNSSRKQTHRSSKESSARVRSSINIRAKKKSETDDNRIDDDTRGNVSSAIETTDNQAKQNPGYSSAVQWEKGEASGDVSVEETKPFKAKRGIKQIADEIEEELDGNLSEGVNERYKARDYDFREQQSNSLFALKRPTPFAAIGLDSKPYKAMTRKRKK
jgi:hypothetical protein